VVEAPARAWSCCVTKNWFNQFLEGPRIGSSAFWIQCESLEGILSGGGPSHGLESLCDKNWFN